MFVLTGFWCWLASMSELMGCKNSSWGEMGLKATKPPRVLCWSRKHVNRHKQRHECNDNTSACMHRLTGPSQRCGPSSAGPGCLTEYPPGGWRHPDAWTLGYSSEMRETNQTTFRNIHWVPLRVITHTLLMCLWRHRLQRAAAAVLNPTPSSQLLSS